MHMTDTEVRERLMQMCEDAHVSIINRKMNEVYGDQLKAEMTPNIEHLRDDRIVLGTQIACASLMDIGSDVVKHIAMMMGVAYLMTWYELQQTPASDEIFPTEISIEP
jgi:hypothetical protein